MISKHPSAWLVIAAAALIASCFGTFYSFLAVGVSDGPGHITAQLTLGACVVAALGALVIAWRATSALLMLL
ncbi:hypothetical protein ACFB49_30440 [Sphingomonas sp. DBB INV C78]